MMKLVKTLAIVGVLNILGSTAVMAQEELTKQQVKTQAAGICNAAAQKRYGDESIVSIGSKANIEASDIKVKWVKSMKGAVIKMKIKAKSKRLAKYSCLVKKDKSVTFFKS